MDVILRNAMLVDGTGALGRPADVALRGERIEAIRPPGELLSGSREVVDLSGLVLAPGFIDVHTHYDAQILWDGDLTPSSWHGVTTVVMGNCGFGIAPTRREDRGLMVELLQNVEGMSPETLNAGIDWSFETYPDYLEVVKRRPKRINVGALIGHSAVRQYVLAGDERCATGAEIARMRELVREAIEAGALGISTSRSEAHQGAKGRPVQSRFADPSEVFELAAVLGELGKGIVQAAAGPGLFVDEYSELADRFGVPVTWTALLARSERPGAALRTIERAAALPGEVYPQVACREIVMQLDLVEPGPLAEVDEWKEVLARPRSERVDLYRDPAWRDRARRPTLTRWQHRWPRISVQETELHRDVIGVPLDRLAVERETTPFDVLIELSLEDTTRTRFRVVMDNGGEEELAQVLADKRALLGLSDAGAHATQLCDACFSTHLLGHWVRERGTLSLEDAVWRLTGHPHQAFRIRQRGLVREGYYADLVAFDPATVAAGEVERVYDQPGDSDRLVARSRGIEFMWVNGVPTRAHASEIPGVAPGVLIRS